jgi:hypothetical protein
MLYTTYNVSHLNPNDEEQVKLFFSILQIDKNIVSVAISM